MSPSELNAVYDTKQLPCQKDHGPKHLSVLSFKYLHFKGSFKVARFEHISFGMTLGHSRGHSCFDSEVSLRGQHIPFGMMHHSTLYLRIGLHLHLLVRPPVTSAHLHHGFTLLQLHHGLSYYLGYCLHPSASGSSLRGCQLGSLLCFLFPVFLLASVNL